MTTYNITLDTYKDLTKQEFLPWDEAFTSIITDWDDEMIYEAPEVEKPELIKYFDKKTKKWYK